MSETQQFDRRRARFMPQRTDDLQPGAAEWIGTERTWQACWPIDDGQFEGQWAWSPADPTEEPYPPFAWVPECDLEWVD